MEVRAFDFSFLMFIVKKPSTFFMCFFSNVLLFIGSVSQVQNLLEEARYAFHCLTFCFVF
jgi:hypothetical protein